MLVGRYFFLLFFAVFVLVVVECYCVAFFWFVLSLVFGFRFLFSCGLVVVVEHFRGIIFFKDGFWNGNWLVEAVIFLRLVLFW